MASVWVFYMLCTQGLCRCRISKEVMLDGRRGGRGGFKKSNYATSRGGVEVVWCVVADGKEVAGV